MRSVRRVLIAAVVGLLAASAVYLYLPAVGDVSPRALSQALARELGTTTFDACQRRRENWRCFVDDRQGSSSPVYRLEMTGSRCWRARKMSRFTEDGPPLAERVDGCVRLRDQLRPVDRLLD